MGFLDTLKHLLGKEREPVAERVARAWGLPAEGEAPEPPPEDTSNYDRVKWRKSLARVLEGLPLTRNEWTALKAEAKALKFEPEWVTKCESDEFMLLVRRIVSDRKIGPEEHEKIDMARQLIGLFDDQAETIVRSVIADAETFFDQPIKVD
jgi:hypothetical protein